MLKKNVFFLIIISINHWRCVILTKIVYATNVQLLFMKTKSQILKNAMNFVQSNVNGMSPIIAMESAFLPTNRATKIV
jgi:hypothetical protein